MRFSEGKNCAAIIWYDCHPSPLNPGRGRRCCWPYNKNYIIHVVTDNNSNKIAQVCILYWKSQICVNKTQKQCTYTGGRLHYWRANLAPTQLRSAKLCYPALRQRIHPPQLRSPLPPLRSSGQQPRPAGCTEVIQTFFVTRRFPIFLTGRQQQRDPFHCGYVPRSVAV